MEGDIFNYHAMPRKVWKLKVKVTIFRNEVIKPGQGGEKNQYIREYVLYHDHNS